MHVLNAVFLLYVVITMILLNFKLEPMTWQKIAICAVCEIIHMNSFIKELW